jgi:hypothetical protein
MNYYKLIDGINLKDRQVYIAKMGFEDDKFSGQYLNQGVTLPANSGVFISDFHFTGGNDFSFIPSEGNGTETNYLADRIYSSMGNRVVRFGGVRGLGPSGGAFCFNGANGSDASSSNATSGARLQYLK